MYLLAKLERKFWTSLSSSGEQTSVFCVFFIKYTYDCNSLFWETICLKYLLRNFQKVDCLARSPRRGGLISPTNFCVSLWQRNTIYLESWFQQNCVTIDCLKTTWTQTKRMEKKLDGNYTRMLRAILNKSWRQHPTKQRLYGHQPPVAKTIKVIQTRHAGHCWRSRDELVSDLLRWTRDEQRLDVQLEHTYSSSLPILDVDLPKAMDDREGWRESQKYPCWQRDMMLVGWLGFLWHINLCRLFNAKSIFM